MFGCLENLQNLKTLDLFYTNIEDIELITILANNPCLEHLNIGNIYYILKLVQ